jgi:hypothetical protein
VFHDLGSRDEPSLLTRRAASVDLGGAATGFLVAVVLLAAVGVAAFFYFGGSADVDIKKPNVSVSGSPVK